MNVVLPLLTILSAVNLVLLALYGWFFRKNEKPFFWMGFMNISIAVVVINNLLIHYHSTHILFYHFSILINISWGAYFLNLLYSFKNGSSYRKQCLLFAPSILYGFFVIYTFFLSGFNNALLQSLYINKPLLANIIPNFITIVYSLGANMYMLWFEIFNRKKLKNDIFRKRRIEIIVSFLSIQIVTFVPYIITQSVTYLIIFLPVVSFITYLWMFFRLQHILNVKEPLANDNAVAYVHFDKYKNIKLNNLEKESIAEKIKAHLIESKSFLECKYSLHDLSVELNLPQHIVSMVINSTMHTTFHDLINKYRFDEALLILNATSHPKIEAIAYDCGFGNRTSFYKVFKKYTGTTPAHYENSNALKNL